MQKYTKCKVAAAWLLAAAMIAGSSLMASAQEPDYSIGNPYADVDWENWKAYKAQLHCQSNVSDGELPLNEVIEEHYRLSYDILAVTDHMAPGDRWDVVPKTVPLARWVKRSRTHMLPIEPLTSERRQEMLDGVGRDGRGMLEVVSGVELNGMTPNNSHVNGFFSTYGQGSAGIDGDYEAAVRLTQEGGGISFLDHLGEYTKSSKKQDPSISSDPKFVNKFAKIFLDYPSCVGTDINSGTNDGTEYDRILYDNILNKTIPYGVVPWAYTFSDAHCAGQYDRAFTMHLMPESSVPELRKSMENGTFLSVARYSYDEQEIGEGNTMDGDRKLFEGKEGGPVPQVNSIQVNEEASTISIDVQDYESISWVSNGKVISNETTLDIAKHDAEIGSFVRAFIKGSDAIVYVQPFTVLRKGQTLEKETVPVTKDSAYYTRKAVNFFSACFPNWSPVRAIWNYIAHFDPAVDLTY